MFCDSELELIEALVGSLTMDMVQRMYQNIDCFLHPKLSLFIPANGQCGYAIKPNHTHPSYTFLYYFQPLQELIMEGKSISYDGIDRKYMVAISPEIPHQEVEQDSFQSYIAILIDKEFFLKVWGEYELLPPIFRGDCFVPHPELLSLLRCFMLSADQNKEKDENLLEHLSHVILHFILLSIVSDNQKGVPLYDRFEVDRAIAFMNSYYSEKISIEDIAAHVSLSSGHFSKVFKTITGSTPIDFLNGIRLQKARNLLINSRKSITELAMECGFNTTSYFSTCFMERFHMTPSSYRQMLLHK